MTLIATYPPMGGFKRMIFFRADEIPAFILMRKGNIKLTKVMLDHKI